MIMDAGLGSFSLEWAAVQSEVARVTRACSFDRPGMGWSEAAASPRDSQRIVLEIHDLLAAAGLKPPYVMVGHSFGGLNARLFASEYLSELAGLVLVESVHEDQVRLLPRPPAWKNTLRRRCSRCPRSGFRAFSTRGWPRTCRAAARRSSVP